MLTLDNISKKYLIPGNRVIVAVDRLSLELTLGAFAVVVGANGAGKSTLFDLIVGHSSVDEGRILIGGVDVTTTAAHKRSRRVTLISQSRSASLPKALTVREVMRLAMESGGGCRNSRLDRACCEKLEGLERNLSRILNSQLWHLSGGEYQLVALAVATVLCEHDGKGHLLLLDEHISQLAPAARDRVVAATVQLVRDRKLTTMLATHSASVAATLGNRQIVLSGGRIHADLTEERRITDADKLRALLVEIATSGNEH
jgi:putative ABC transport system ATP-binding protein